MPPCTQQKPKASLVSSITPQEKICHIRPSVLSVLCGCSPCPRSGSGSCRCRRRKCCQWWEGVRSPSWSPVRANATHQQFVNRAECLVAYLSCSVALWAACLAICLLAWGGRPEQCIRHCCKSFHAGFALLGGPPRNMRVCCMPSPALCHGPAECSPQHAAAPCE